MSSSPLFPHAAVSLLPTVAPFLLPRDDRRKFLFFHAPTPACPAFPARARPPGVLPLFALPSSRLAFPSCQQPILPPHLACRGSPVPFGHFLRLRPLTSPPALLASRPASLAALPSLAWRTGPPYSPPVRRPFPAPLLSGQTSLLIKRCIGGGSCLSPRASYKLGTSAGSGAIV